MGRNKQETVASAPVVKKEKAKVLSPWRCDTVSGKLICVQAYDKEDATRKIQEEYKEQVQNLEPIT